MTEQFYKINSGFIVLQDKMGSDQDIVSAARVSYLGESKGEEKDKKLLFYLMRNEHWTPFETAQLRIRVKCDLPTARQWFRHRSFHFNEVSRRYTDEQIEFYLPEQWRGPGETSKQASMFNPEIDQNEVTRLVNLHYSRSYDLYVKLEEMGIAKEQARYVLPQAMYTQFVFVADLRNLLNFCRLRSHSHAQLEIREYSDIILHHFIKDNFPWTYESAMECLFNE